MVHAPRPGAPSSARQAVLPGTPAFGRLRSETLSVDSLSAELAEHLFGLYARHYDAVDRRRFEADLRDKQWVILLRDATDGRVRGFSTQTIFETRDPEGARVRVLFSGDTIIDPEYWGEQELVRGWCRFAGQALAEKPETPLYWLLISKGYRTYLYLPLFFRDYWPRFDKPDSPFQGEFLAAVAEERFASYYQPSTSLLRFPRSQGQLKPGLAEVPAGRREDPRVKFFLERNPRYALGEELVCLARISPENMRAIAARCLREGIGRGALRELA